MAPDPLQERIRAQFSYRGERSDIWRVFDLLLDTDAFLNLGYSRWYQPHVLGSCQRRLATTVGRRLADHLPETDGVSLLDVGSGRGGPAIHLADRFGFDVLGVDIVEYNVARARDNALASNSGIEFVVGDATQLPVAAGSIGACTAVDALVYFPDRWAVFDAVADALRQGGVLAFSDLVMRPDASEREQRAVGAFARGWDMPPLATVPEYREALADAGFDVLGVRNLTPNSVGQFRKWTTLFRWLQTTPLRRLADRGLASQGLDPDAIRDQIHRAHEALPALDHALVVARRR
jgi:MPBQ/MSBQ methyltransferase